MPLLVSLFFGFVPMFFFAALVYWLDRYEKEPKILLGATFFWGVVIAAGGAFIINTAFGIGIYVFTGSEGAAEIGTTSIVAPDRGGISQRACSCNCVLHILQGI